MTSTDALLRPSTRTRQGKGMGRRYVTEWRTTKDCVIYARVSTGERKNSRQISIKDQVELATKAAEALGYRVVKVYQDGRSRGVRRQGLVTLLREIEEMENVGAVFVWHDTRLWGHQEQQRFLLYRFRKVGARVFDSKGKEWKDDTPWDKLVNMFSAGLSEYETGMTAQRIYELYTGRAEKGELLTRPTYGVKVLKHFEGERVVSEWVVDQEQMEIIRRIFREYGQGKRTYQIAKDLNAEGVPTQQGSTAWSPVNIRRYLDNPFYVGTLVWNQTKTEWEIDQETGDKIKRVKYRREHEHITAPSPLGCILAPNPHDPAQKAAAIDLWTKAQRRRETAGRERAPREYDLRVLADLVICARCESRMQARRFGHKSKKTNERTMTFDFRCPHRANFGTGCTASHTMTENQVWKKLTASFGDDVAEGTPEGLVTWQDGVTIDITAMIKAAEREVEKRRQAVERVHVAWETTDAYATVEAFRDRLAVVTADHEQALNELEAAQRMDAGRPQELTDERRQQVHELLVMLQRNDVDLTLRRAAAADLIYQIRVDNPRIHVILH